MATSKLMLDKDYKNAEQTFPLVLRISHKSKKKYIQTGFHLKPEDWDEIAQRVNKTFKNSGRVNAKLAKINSTALEVISSPREILKNMTVFDLSKVIEAQINGEFNKMIGNINSCIKEEVYLGIYGQKIISRYRKAKRHGMADSFEDAINVILKYNGGKDISLSQITITFLEDLEAYWLGNDNKLGGLGVHLRAIRRIFNLAIQDENNSLNKDTYPFGNHGYKIKKGRSKKRAIDPSYIQSIRDLKYEINSPIWHHRNYFLFMFNLRGMNFVDLSYLTLENLNGDRLIYERKKTKRGDNVKTFNIKLTKEAKTILSHYIKGKTKKDLIFPILEDVINSKNDLRIHQVRKQRMANHNRRLNKIAKDIGLEDKLTTYVARHTFATTGLFKGVSKTQIGEMLGHTSAVTTEAYFDEFDKEILDDAADIILN